MLAYPGPTYVIGIDEQREQGYLLSVNEPRTRGFGSIPMRYPMTFRNLQFLWEEVHAFWDNSQLAAVHSRFAI
jgi:hypothetical protein